MRTVRACLGATGGARGEAPSLPEVQEPVLGRAAASSYWLGLSQKSMESSYKFSSCRGVLFHFSGSGSRSSRGRILLTPRICNRALRTKVLLVARRPRATEVTLLAADARSVDAFDLLRAFDANLKWARSHNSELTKHSGKFVAIADSQVLGEADNPKELEEKFAGKKGLYVTFVTLPGLLWVL